MLEAGIGGNLDTLLHALRYGIGIDRVQPRLPRWNTRGDSPNRGSGHALVRAYRMGQRQDDRPRASGSQRHGWPRSGAALIMCESDHHARSDYIDWISHQVTDAYETERERWVENRNSVRALRVRELLDSAAGSVDIDAAIAAIGYPLRLTHLAMILWTTADEAPGRELLRLERFVRDLADSMALRDGALFVAADQVSGWGWLPLGTAATADPVEHIRRFAADSADPPQLAVGTAQPGLEGFRRSHRQAQKARRVAVAGAQNRRVTAAGDPGWRPWRCSPRT